MRRAPAFRWQPGRSSVVVGLLAVVCLLRAAPVFAQAVGTTYVLASSTIRSGQVAWDSRYTLTATLGPEAAGTGSTSANHTLRSGFASVIDPPVTGPGAVPWPLAVRPWLVDFSLSGATSLALAGAELNSGGPPGLQIGSHATSVQVVTRSLVSFTMPPGVAPGFHDLELTSQVNRAAVIRALGVRPALELARPAAVNRSLQVTVHAHAGDVLWLGASLGFSPWRVVVPPFFNEFRLDPVTFVFLGAYPVTTASGTMTLVLPSPGITYPVVLQGLVMTGGPSGYAPGSFTNVISL